MKLLFGFLGLTFLVACTAIGNSKPISTTTAQAAASTPAATPSPSPSSSPSPSPGPIASSVSPYSQWKNTLPTDPTFFPIGVWLQSPQHIQEYKNIGVNLFVGFYGNLDQSSLQLFHDAQMPLIVEQNSVGLSSPQNSAIASWAQPDEPDNAQSNSSGGYDPCITPQNLINNYNTWTKADSTRPVYLGFGRGVSDINWVGRGTCTGDTNYYVQASAAGDILSFDIYPVSDGTNQLEAPSIGTTNLIKWSGGKKIVWNDIEASAIGGGSVPTASQIRSEIWMALIHGSMGIVYFVHEFSPTFREDGIFNHPELVSGVTSINAEIKSLAPVLNSSTVSNGVSITSTVPVDAMAKQYGGNVYVFAAAMKNNSTNATITVPSIASGTVEVINENRSLTISSNKFQDNFAGYGIHLYKISASP